MEIVYPANFGAPRTICTRAIPAKTTFHGVIDGKRSLYLKTIERIVDLESSVVKDGRTYEVTDYQVMDATVCVDPTAQDCPVS